MAPLLPGLLPADHMGRPGRVPQDLRAPVPGEQGQRVCRTGLPGSIARGAALGVVGGRGGEGGGDGESSAEGGGGDPEGELSPDACC